jgi:CHRD domain/IPTL-CTERM motif/Prealbumin-like fold domain
MNKKNLALLTFIVCVSVPAYAQQFIFDLRGSQEVPPVPSTASGGCYGELNQGAGTFAITCVHDVENATVMHIHRGAAGENGAIAFDMGDPASGFVTATWTGMTAADISDLLAGNLYMNIHTAGRPAGEIRGQILPRTVDTVAFTANGEQVVPPNDSTATANCTANLNDPATALDVSCGHTFPSPAAAHIHEAPVGENGPIVFTFANPAVLTGSVPMTPRLIAGFAATFLYLDVHAAGGTEENPADEIRGQIGTPPAGAGTGTIIIAKETYPGGGTSFEFTESITAGTFMLDHGQSETFTSVAPGVYSVTESDPSAGGYTLAAISCEDDGNSSGNVATRTATIDVAAGEIVRCTFENFETAPTDQLFVFHLSGDQEAPPVATTERGGCMGRFDAAAHTFSLVCTHNVDSPTVMHIHRGAPGVNGEIAFDMGSPVSPVVATWSGMTPADEADLLAGNLYLNIHTSGRPAGAIRGQILPRTIDTVAFTLNAAQAVPPGDSPSTGNCTADLNSDATSLAFACTHNLPAPDVAHVHQGERGENGPVVFTFPSPASPINAPMPLTPRLVADYAAELLYMDIHGADAGEETATPVIRGQIGAPATVVTTGTIRIVKGTSPAGGAGFAFVSDIPTSPGPFVLNDGQERVFTSVPAGTYTVTENAFAGWSLTDVVCTDADSVGNAFNGTATVALEAGETVTCTFRNLQSVTPTALFVFHLSPEQEVPPTTSDARGGCFGQLNQTTRRLSLVCTHNVGQPVIAHIHRAPAGANGPIVFDLGDPTSPMEAVWDMTPAEMADLLAGNYYVNIHASGRPDGEIRGQMLTRTVDAFTFVANAQQEVPPTDSTATGNCRADLADNATSVLVECSHNVDQIIDTHVHAAPPGTDGPPIFHFPNTNTFSGNVPLSPRLVADFAAGFLYVNIHSVEYETGEIRGNFSGTAAPSHLGDVPTASEWALIVMALMLGVVAWRRMG